MTQRWFAVASVAACVIAGVVVLTQEPVSGQTSAATANRARDAAPARTAAWKPPRTPDGRPDLQGTWDFRTLTPLERPDNFSGKDVLTAEEAVQLEERAAQNRVDREPPKGNPGTYNQFWFDFGTRVTPTNRTALIVDPPDGKVPPMTPDGQKRAQDRAERMRRPASGPEDRALYERCILGFNSGPPIIPNGYNNNLELLQRPDYIVILTEMVHDARIVPLDGRPHLPPSVRQWSGDSRGRWDGDTLVVETTNFTHKGTGTISLPVTTDENLHLVERFTLADADTLVYEFTVRDATTWTKPWTAVVHMKRNPARIYEYACHEGNYGMAGILKGARADENKPAAAAR
jgi:hypothetical protein